jgi:hypothetical protein
MKHKHYDVMMEWAADTSKIVQVRDTDTRWMDIEHPSWDIYLQYRIKPDPKPDQSLYLYLSDYGRSVHVLNGFNTVNTERIANLKVTFDGETGKLKDAVVI